MNYRKGFSWLQENYYNMNETQSINIRTKQVMCAIYDSKVRQHMSPIFARTTEEAIRSFRAAATQEGHDFKKFSEDYTLWVVGYFYPETGDLEPCSKHQIASATEFA